MNNLLKCSLGLLLLTSTVVQALEGRLFYSPEQRAALDQLRNNPASANQNKAAVINNAGQSFTLRGVMQRSDGQTIIWLNDKMQTHANSTKRGNQSPDEITVRTDDSKDISLKVGQSLKTSKQSIGDKGKQADFNPNNVKLNQGVSDQTRLISPSQSSVSDNAKLNSDKAKD